MSRLALVLCACGCLCLSLLCAAYTSWQLIDMVKDLKKRIDKLEGRNAVGGAFYG